MSVAEPSSPADPDKMYGDAVFLLWRLRAMGRTDLWDLAIGQSYRWSMGRYPDFDDDAHSRCLRCEEMFTVSVETMDALCKSCREFVDSAELLDWLVAS